ncbi:hypothetical protein, partial [Mesorhizobium sp. M2E.F.Ca.ET.166.01.1.1]|uniref:hypothetical protein n=1 Tax=Mesorhizobium sp. M2E.F.Ca.ET.166.01.1.1 TaxID=2500523 RepID=UPI001AEE3EAC
GDVGDRSSAEFHHDARHGSEMPLTEAGLTPERNGAPGYAEPRKCAASLAKTSRLRKRWRG